jgi:hypothetical protein
MPFQMLTSVFGRRLGISSSGGLVMGAKGSTVIDRAAVMTDSTGARLNQVCEPLTAASSSGATISNDGLTTLNHSSATTLAFVLQRPAAGSVKRLASLSTSSAIVIDTSATTIVFQTSGGASSTSLTFGAANNKGEFAVLVGLSTAKWMAMGKSGGVT